MASEHKVQFNNVFILPTPLGYLYALATVLLIVGAINYQNSMAYIMAFWMMAIGFVVMIFTVRNLVGLVLSPSYGREATVGESLGFCFAASSQRNHRNIRLEGGTSVDVSAGESAKLMVLEKARRRGLHFAPRIKVVTAFPSGLFRAWTYAHVNASTLVYPKAIDPSMWPSGTADEQDESESSSAKLGEQFFGLRPFQQGDSMSRVAWSAYAKTGMPFVKDLRAETAVDNIFSLDNSPANDLELKLSHLAHWCIEAENKGLSYGLVLGSQRHDTGTGEAHLRQCLKALAMYGEGR
jgi:uncharacterized protein (DUF58 family)